MVTYRRLPPNETDSRVARKTKQQLAAYAQEERSLTVRITDSEQDTAIEIPAGAVSLLMDILDAMASGQGVTLIPENAELTTVQAADVLNVSRPYLVKLLENGKIPFRKVGKHRRVLMEDVMAYKRTIDQKREKVLDQLVADAQAQNMGYD